jgi:hypothetical protein
MDKETNPGIVLPAKGLAMTEGYENKLNGCEENDVDCEGDGCIGELGGNVQGENEESKMDRKEKDVHGSKRHHPHKFVTVLRRQRAAAIKCTCCMA